LGGGGDFITIKKQMIVLEKFYISKNRGYITITGSDFIQSYPFVSSRGAARWGKGIVRELDTGVRIMDTERRSQTALFRPPLLGSD